MLARTTGASLIGVRGVAVSVEVDAGRGLPAFHIVGSGDRVVAEGRDRIRAAFRQIGLEFPPGRVTVNLAPSDLPKSGSALDLAIGVAIAATRMELPESLLRSFLFVGELGLDGGLRRVRGTLALLSAASEPGCAQAIVPSESLAEAALCAEARVHGAPDLAAVLDHLAGNRALELAAPRESKQAAAPEIDLADVVGQDAAKRALLVAAAGGHHLLLCGPPGTGKTMLAERLPGLLPALTAAERVEVTRVHGVAGVLGDRVPPERAPFRAPHHTASAIGLIGGGQPIRPGEISLAHRGVLFLDELPEWRRSVLETLRQPLEAGAVRISRAHGSVELPASFLFVGAMNPCPCGYRGDAARECTCDPALVKRYLDRISGPLLDRIDLHVPVPSGSSPPPWAERDGPTSGQLGEQVQTARTAQAARATQTGALLNAQLPAAALRDLCRPGPAGERLLERAAARLGLSLRAQARVLRVARTIADLEGSARIEGSAVAEAIGYRWLDRDASGP